MNTTTNRTVAPIAFEEVSRDEPERDWSRIYPMHHYLIVHCEYFHPENSPLHLNIVRHPSPDYLPDEIPERIRKLLISFLLGSHPVPHKSLQTIIDPRDAKAARRVFQELVKHGFTPGEAIIESGIMVRKEWHNVPAWFHCRVVSAGCDCVLSVGDTGFINSASGDILDTWYRRVHCGEVQAQETPA